MKRFMLLLTKAVCASILICFSFSVYAEETYATGTYIFNELGIADLSYIKTDEGIVITGALTEEKTVKVPEMIEGLAVIGIKEKAFSVCNYLESVALPQSIRFIGNSAFRECLSLTGISLSSGLVEIEDFAFYQCVSLQNITIPATVTRIGEHAFDYSAKLTAINVESENPVYSSIDGVLYNKNADELIKYPPSLQTSKYIIPGGVAVIYPRAFNYAYLLEQIEMPDTVESIGEYAFSNCSSLRELRLTENVLSVGENAFEGCTGLTTLTVESSPQGLDAAVYSDISPAVYANADSTAKTFAQVNGLSFIELKETEQEDIKQSRLRIITKTLEPAWRFFPYRQEIELSSETAELMLKENSLLPKGLTLTDNVIAGQPEVWGIYRFTLCAADGEEQVEQSYTLNIGTDEYEQVNSYDITTSLPLTVTINQNGQAPDISLSVLSGENPLTAVYIDGHPIEKDQYRAFGETIVIDGGALSELSVGTHVMVARYEGGTATAAPFKVMAEVAPVNEPQEDTPDIYAEDVEDDSENPQTSDEGTLALIVLCSASVFAVVRCATNKKLF